MDLFLGIDGGGSGCRAVLADAQGRVLARAEAGPANIHSDPPGALANILAVTRGVLAEAGADPARVRAGLGLAGGNVAARRAPVLAALPVAAARIESDGWTAARGALGQDDGIVAAFGTGSVWAVQRGGAIRLAGGWGFLLGDEGGGAPLGRAALAAALAALDGLPPGPTPLAQALLDRHGGAEGVVAFAARAAPADFARLAPEIMASDDPLALAVTRAAGDAIRAMRHALDPAGALPLVVLGGLGAAWAGRLGLATVPPRGQALDGALALAREAG
jgi:glucosamine kinase